MIQRTPNASDELDADATMPNARSYGEISAILTDQDGSDVSEEYVRQTCESAENKIRLALCADPVLCQLLSSRNPPGDGTTNHDTAAGNQDEVEHPSNLQDGAQCDDE